MKLRRLFALLMAALMLLGMIPAAQAQDIWCPDLGLEHDWSTPEYDYGTCEWGFKYCKRCGAGSEVPPQHKWVTRTTLEPGCETPGYQESICSSCNSEQGNPQEIPALGHNWGGWRWVHGEPPCNSNGAWQVRDCQRCGTQEDRWVEGGVHSFGPWETTQDTTCMAPGRQEHTCTRCGHTEWNTIPKLEHVFGEWHVITPAQIGVPGLEQRDCTYSCGTNEQRQIPPLDPNRTDTGSSSGLNVYKKLIDRPADETVGFVAGEQISYMITVENKTGVDLFNLEISDPLRNGNPVIATYPKMPADEGVTVHFYYIITDADVANGSIVNTAYASAETAGGLPVNGTSNTVTTPVGTKSGSNDFIVGTIIPTEPKDPVAGLDIRMEDTLTPANGAYYVPDEWIEYRYNYGNTGDVDLMNGTVYAPTVHSGGHWTVVPSLPANTGTRERGLLRHRVTEQDAINGSIDLYVYIVAYDADGNEYTATSNIVTAPCGSGEPANVPGLSVAMTYTNTPANGSFFTPGEAIDYLITVTNTGDVPLTNLQVGNSSSEAVVPAPSEIAPGQTIQVPYYKLVYEGDAKAGGIDSYGHANAFNGDPALPESLVSGRSTDVFVPCGMGDGTPSVYYLKIVANAPANGLYFTEGETIKYRLSFGNNTKKDIYNITLNDPMANTRSVAFARRLKAGEFLMGEFEHVVTAADVEAGQIVNTATSTWATKAEGAQTTTPSNTVVTPCGSGVPSTGSIDAMLEKYVKNEPANGEYFGPGETIEYAVIFMNTCPHELHDVEVYDPLKGSNEDITIVREPIVAPNGTLYLSFNYTVTEEDAARGTVVNTASALWLNPETEEWSSCDSNTVTTLVGHAVTNDVAIIKTIENAPANGVYFVPGEVIQFAVAVQNSSAKTLDVVVLTDPLSADFFHELLDIPGGAMDSRTFSYTVTELDAEIGSVINYAYAVAYVDGKPTSLISNTASAPCGFPEGDDPFGVLTGLEITKVVESLPLNGSYYTEGETVAYKISYTNIGEMPLTDVMLYDALGGMSEIATAETLNPGESRMCWFNYTVTAADAARGYIANTAIGQFELNGFLNSVNSNTVVVDTDGQPDPDGFDFVWGTFIPTAPGGSGADHCVTTLNGWNSNSIDTQTFFCSNHAALQDTISIMMSTAADDASKQRAYEYAISLWQADLEQQYTDMLAIADPAARALLINEYVQFCAWAGNYQTMLTALYPDQPLLAARLTAQVWQNQCIGLCGEFATAPAQPTDSLSLMAQGADALTAANICTKESAAASGAMTSTDVFCAEHSFLFGMTSALLRGENTADSWSRIVQMWKTELNKTYNALYTAAGDEYKAACLIERNIFQNWLTAREAELRLLYPENPEIAAELLTREIMAHVADLCAAGQ